MAEQIYPSFLSHAQQFEWHRARIRQLESRGHVVVNTIDGRLRPCKYCSDRKIKTKSGHLARTRNKCHLCDVPLCTKNRNCFHLYHEWLFKWKRDYMTCKYFDVVWCKHAYFIWFFTLVLYVNNSVVVKSRDCFLAGNYDWLNAPSNVQDPLQGSEVFLGHRLVPMLEAGSRRKRCKYCQKHRLKTAAGGIAETSYHCQACLVPLCPGIRTGRNCFALYHLEFVMHNFSKSWMEKNRLKGIQTWCVYC